MGKVVRNIVAPVVGGIFGSSVANAVGGVFGGGRHKNRGGEESQAAPQQQTPMRNIELDNFKREAEAQQQRLTSENKRLNEERRVATEATQQGVQRQQRARRQGGIFAEGPRNQSTVASPTLG